LLVAEFALSFVLTVAAVAAAIKVCAKHGWVAKPQPDRWHNGTPAQFGGVSIWLVVLTLSACVIPATNGPLWIVLACASLMFALGLIDDLVRLQPGPKLLAQCAVSALSIVFGLKLAIPGHPIVSFCVSLGWLIGLTNAFNLLDNMDGLAVGVALLAASYWIIIYVIGGSADYASILLIVAGASAGFLVFNFSPARIFMGDSGSLFLGFLLASASLPQFCSGSAVPALVLTPVIVLAIPILDTFFVSVTRRLRGQPVSLGGTDHSSHRLVRLGLPERKAVLLLYTATAASGAVAIAARRLPYPEALGLMLLWLFFLLLFGIHLFHTEPSSNGEHAHPLLQSLLQHDSLAFLLDPAVLLLSYYLAYLLRFESVVPRSDFAVFLHSWPIVLVVKWGIMLAGGIYRHSWWRGAAGDAYRLAATSAIGEALAVLIVVGIYGFSGYSRVAFVADFVISWMLLIVLRRSFYIFRASIRYLGSAGSQPSRRVFVLGTSENAEVVLRFLESHKIKCAGLIDTNGGSDVRRHVFGMEVVGQVQDLPRLAATHRISELILPENEAMPCSEAEFVERCSRDRLQVVKLGLHQLFPIPPGQNTWAAGPIVGLLGTDYERCIGPLPGSTNSSTVSND
jgi:UDP-GlcNAc:undecaprenyl-phosphate GlcNAc-1-phosphate transferase